MKQENMSTVKQEKGSALKFEMRAPPRRRAKGDELEEQPVFLRKAFHMISTCPPEIGGWSQHGDTVVIKDVKEFSEKVIPTAYKHNNFSSFVRQLNFYGFRKVKSESLQNPTWWEFRHPNFLRDQPQLLSDMKRSMHFDGNGQEVSELKHQVANLTEKIAALNMQVEKLTGAVSHIQLQDNSNGVDVGLKRKKLHVKTSTETRMAESEGAPLQRINSLESNLMIEEFKADDVPTMEGKFDWLNPSASNGENLVDEDDMLDCIGIDEFDLATTPRAPSSRNRVEDTNQFNSTVVSNGCLDENLPTAKPVIASPSTPLPAIATSELAMFFDCLTPELKLRFVDKLAEFTSMQMVQNRGVFPVSATAEVSTELPYESNEKHEFYLPSGSPAPRIALPLASAALSAFMMSNLQYAPSNTSSSSMPVNTPEVISSRG